MNVSWTKRNTFSEKKKKLKEVLLDKNWPLLSPRYLFFKELEQDPYYSFINKDQIIEIIEKAIQFGQETAKAYGKDANLKELINILLQQGVLVHFERSPSNTGWVRAQYTRKPAKITVYRSSIEQMKQFFLQMKESIHEDEFIRLHLFHEWFHHLEETKCGFTTHVLPKVKLKQWGPFMMRKPIQCTREIAAHAFTQEAMELNWSPLLLDYLLLYVNQSWSKSQIREHFHLIKQQFQQLETPPLDEEEQKGDI